MTKRLLILGCWLMLLGSFSLLHVAAQDKQPAKPEATDGPQKVADLLDRKIDLPALDDPTVTLENILEFFTKEHKLRARVNEKAFAAEGVPDVEKVQICERPLPEMKNTRISEVLSRILERISTQSGAFYLIRRDGIEITTGEFLRQEVWGNKFQGPYLPLVRLHAKELPLNKALADLATQSDRNILVDPRLKEKVEQKVSVSFVNAPLDTVMLFLCMISDSDFVIRDNVIFVTTKENAATLKARFKEEEKQADRDDPDVIPGPRIGTNPKLNPMQGGAGIGGIGGLLGRAPQVRPGVKVGGATLGGPGIGGLGSRPVQPMHFVVAYPEKTAEKPRSKLLNCSKSELAAQLEKKIDLPEVDDPQGTLEQALQYLTKEHGVKFRVDERAFDAEGFQDVLSAQIAETKFPAMKDTRLCEVLDALGNRVQSTSGVRILINPGYVEITTGTIGRERIWGKANWFPRLPLVHLPAKKQTISDALQHAAAQANRNVMIDPRVKKQLAMPISLELCNTPLDTAYLFLTNVADADFMIRDNVMFVTDKKSAITMRKRFEKEPKEQSEDPLEGPRGHRLGEDAGHDPEIWKKLDRLDRMERQRIQGLLDPPFSGEQ